MSGGDWLVLAVYVAAAGLSLMSAVSIGRYSERRLESSAMFLIAAGLAVLAFFDLVNAQDTVGWASRSALWRENLYWSRREIQTAVILLVVVAAAIAVTTVTVVLRRSPVQNPVAAALALAGFLAMRTISLHQVDAALYKDFAIGLTRNDAIEVALVLLVGLSVATNKFDPSHRETGLT